MLTVFRMLPLAGVVTSPASSSSRAKYYKLLQDIEYRIIYRGKPISFSKGDWSVSKSELRWARGGFDRGIK